MDSLSDIPKTLLIPLWGRARATLQGIEDCSDIFALEMLEADRFDLSALDKLSSNFKKMMIRGIAVRTRLFDQAINNFLEQNSQAVIVNLGCGLDYRSYRLGDKNTHWYNIDVASTHGYRQALLPARDNITEIEGGIDQLDWINDIHYRRDHKLLLISEGTFMYFDESVIENFLQAFSKKHPNHRGYIEMVGDFAKNKVHPSVKAIGVNCAFQHGLRDARASFQHWLPMADILQVDNLFNHAPNGWGWWGVVFKLFPSWRYRLGSILLDYQLSDDEGKAKSKQSKLNSKSV